MIRVEPKRPVGRVYGPKRFRRPIRKRGRKPRK